MFGLILIVIIFASAYIYFDYTKNGKTVPMINEIKTKLDPVIKSVNVQMAPILANTATAAAAAAQSTAAATETVALTTVTATTPTTIATVPASTPVPPTATPVATTNPVVVKMQDLASARDVQPGYTRIMKLVPIKMGSTEQPPVLYTFGNGTGTYRDAAQKCYDDPNCKFGLMQLESNIGAYFGEPMPGSEWLPMDMDMAFDYIPGKLIAQPILHTIVNTPEQKAIIAKGVATAIGIIKYPPMTPELTAKIARWSNGDFNKNINQMVEYSYAMKAFFEAHPEKMGDYGEAAYTLLTIMIEQNK